MSREKKIVIVSIVMGSIAIVLAAVSAVLFAVGKDATSAVGIVSTIISVLLSVVSIGYSYYSGAQTSQTLAEIISQNKKLVDKINAELGKDNFDDVNLEDVRGD